MDVKVGVSAPPASHRRLPLRSHRAGREVSRRQFRQEVSSIRRLSSSPDWLYMSCRRALGSIRIGRDGYEEKRRYMIDKIVNQSKLSSPQRQLPQSRYLVWSGYAVFVWSIAYMLPHLYWALGGRLGLSMLKPSILELPQWEMINWVASVFLTATGSLVLPLFISGNAVF